MPREAVPVRREHGFGPAGKMSTMKRIRTSKCLTGDEVKFAKADQMHFMQEITGKRFFDGF